MKIASVVGARPQFIKAAPLDRELRQLCTHVLIHTGQHYDYSMSAIFFEELHIPEPDYNLGVGSGSHGRQTGEMLIRIEETLQRERPDCVVVYGDTNSTLAGALAAAKLHLPVAHVEAGLRSFDRSMPEEINRVLTDHLADILFCPTETARSNLSHEGIAQGVFNFGDLMYDAVLHSVDLLDKRSDLLSFLGLQSGRYLLITVHRPANTDQDQNLSSILDALGETHEEVVFPAHPRTTEALARLGREVPPNVRLLEPVSYVNMLCLEKNARLVLTDSGGMQKEAYLLGVPCVTLRKETEWVETVEAGWNLLVGASKDRILEAVHHFRPERERPSVFGDGRASERMAWHLQQAFES
ncbi:MAG TPA: UDP-N-acetylglucosamine 2-epimerase (non-hydrolyzing) [Chloroflexi bacterium]|nr:UDP-N-acetylglucosamine 2-epimerase (non-hydrolyzing) [Chloroflexota bacterium]